MSYSSSANPQYFFAKISGIGPWVSRTNWCKGHWCGSTYMVVRLSDLSSKKGEEHKKYIFIPFLSIRRTAWQPYKLNHINPLRINLSYLPKDQSVKFLRKNIEDWRSWKMTFFWFLIIGFLKKNTFGINWASIRNLVIETDFTLIINYHFHQVWWLWWVEFGATWKIEKILVGVLRLQLCSQS